MNKKIIINYQNLIDKGDLAFIKDIKENLYAKIFIDGKLAGMEMVGSGKFSILFKELYFNRYRDLLSSQDMQVITEIITMEGRKITKKAKLSKRIYRNKDVYLYQLEPETNKVVWIEDGEVSIEIVEQCCFKNCLTDDSQIEPNLSVSALRLIGLLHKHFRFKTDEDMKLFALYLVSCFLGLESLQHPILILKGEKGAAKSTTMRMLSKLVSPQKNELGGSFNNVDDLQLAISNSYMLTLDNMRTIPKKVSDVLCRVVTGGSYQKRKLYTDGDMISMDLSCILVISSIAMPVKEPDLLDRSLALELDRIDADQRKSEAEIWKAFNKDLPSILGSIFNIIAKVLQDNEPMEKQGFIRLVDFHQACIRIGKVVGIKSKTVDALLIHNRDKINETVVCDDIAIGCFVQYMRMAKKFCGSVTELLSKLCKIAARKEIFCNDMPKSASHLSRRLNRVKGNLEETYDIYYTILNTGPYRQIIAEYRKKC